MKKIFLVFVLIAITGCAQTGFRSHMFGPDVGYNVDYTSTPDWGMSAQRYK